MESRFYHNPDDRPSKKKRKKKKLNLNIYCHPLNPLIRRLIFADINNKSLFSLIVRRPLTWPFIISPCGDLKRISRTLGSTIFILRVSVSIARIFL